jgi:hypothetical protein
MEQPRSYAHLVYRTWEKAQEHLHGLDVEIDGTALDISSLVVISR